MKQNLTKVMAMGMVLAMLGTATAFAEEAAKAPETALDTMMEEAQGSAFISRSGKVVSVSGAEENGLREVEIDNEQGGLRFVLGAETVIVNRADGSYLTAADLTEGMEVAVIYAENSPMGMSIPPYLGSVTAVIANADTGFYTVGHFDDTWTDMKNLLTLNISEETSIQNLKGAKIRLSAEDVKNQDALVFYDATTRSIPAQTNPSFVLLLTAEEVPAAEVEEEQEDMKPEETIMVPLRATAEKMGYTVTWQGKEKPVLLEKDDTSMQVTIGQNDYVVEDDMVKAAARAPYLEDGVLYVSSELFA